MIKRQPLKPNNRPIARLFTKTVSAVKPKSWAKDQSVFSYLRTGRPAQDDGDSGGGYRIM
jgi:hypothetical protein